MMNVLNDKRTKTVAQVIELSHECFQGHHFYPCSQANSHCISPPPAAPGVDYREVGPKLVAPAAAAMKPIEVMVRSVLHILPYQLPNFLIPHAGNYVVRAHNATVLVSFSGAKRTSDDRLWTILSHRDEPGTKKR